MNKNKKLPLIKKENGILYIRVGDRYLPDIIKPTGRSLTFRFNRARARFLLNHRRDIFLKLQEDGRLLEHLDWIEEEAYNMIDFIMGRMLEADPIPESLKNTDMLEWVGLMNNYHDSAVEIVMHELIYREGLLDEMEDMELPDIDIDEVFREYSPEELRAMNDNRKAEEE